MQPTQVQQSIAYSKCALDWNLGAYTQCVYSIDSFMCLFGRDQFIDIIAACARTHISNIVMQQQFLALDSWYQWKINRIIAASTVKCGGKIGPFCD